MKGEFVDVAGARLYCWAAGTRGPACPLVFIHGFPTSSRIWQPVVPLIQPGHRMLLFDQLGFGRSDPPDGHDVSIAGHTVRLLALLDAMGIDRAGLVGHDVGALVAWRAAQVAPDRVAGLVLLAPPTRERLAGPALKLGRLARAAPAPIRRALLVRATARGWSDPSGRDRRQRARQAMRGVSALSLGRHLRDLAASATDPLLDPTRPPPDRLRVGIGVGRRDPWSSPRVARGWAAGIPGADCRVWDEAGHFVSDDAPAAVADFVHALCSR